MKKLIISLILSLSSQIPLAHASYIIDGDLSDWGVLLNGGSQNAGYLDTHPPSGGLDIDYITEDNADINSGFIQVGPGWSIGNRYDVEAIYLDNDLNDLYIAVITGLPPNEVDYPGGDIFIDTGKYQNPSSLNYNVNKFAYGIDITTSKLYSVNKWRKVSISNHSVSNPWEIKRGVFLTDVEFVYSGNQNSHYVLEAKVPLSFLNLSAQPGNPDQDVWIHWTMKCGNDYLNLHGDVNAVPEPSSLSLLAGGLLLSAVKRLSKRPKKTHSLS